MTDSRTSTPKRAPASEERQILNAYKALIKDCMPFTNKEERRQIRRAFEFAADAHREDRRKSGEPYIFHPIAVARTVVREVNLHDTTSVIAALLHDTVEDTYTSFEDIEMAFGSEVRGIVDGLTKISGVFDLTTTSKQAENFRKMLLTLSDDIRVVLIKLADRLHNMRTLESMNRAGQLKIASETNLLYAPLAHRFGLYNLKSELEDLALRYTEPDVYFELLRKLQASKTERNRYIQNFIRPVRERMNSMGLKTQIKGRVKSISSIYEKMKRQGVPFEEVYDVFAVRIIIDNGHKSLGDQKNDCWKVYNAITNLYQRHPDRLRDWISVPKANGYMALHTTVMGPRGRWVEVQIRSREMDKKAESGHAAHWLYKSDSPANELLDKSFEEWLSKIRELLDNERLNPRDFVKEVKTSLISEEIYVFTPKGELKILPAGATALDFAYHIHTNIGHMAIGAKVNQRLESLNYRLQNGDQVEVLTSEMQHPEPEWVRYAATNRALHKIKDALKEQRRAIAARGREIFNWRAKHLQVGEDHQAVRELLAEFHIPTVEDLYYMIGSHQIDVKKLSEFIQRKIRYREVYDEHASESSYARFRQFELDQYRMQTLGDGSKTLEISQENAGELSFAECCLPIPGDEAVGYTDPETGLHVHRVNCPQAQELLSSVSNKMVRAEWAPDQLQQYLSALRLVGQDHVGILNKIVRVISLKQKRNIRSITIDTREGTFDGEIALFVRDRADLEEIQTQLLDIKGLHGVTRILRN